MPPNAGKPSAQPANSGCNIPFPAFSNNPSHGTSLAIARDHFDCPHEPVYMIAPIELVDCPLAPDGTQALPQLRILPESTQPFGQFLVVQRIKIERRITANLPA